MATSEALKSLITKRGNIKGQVTRFKDYLKSTTVDKSEIEVRAKRVEELFSKFEDVQQEIEQLAESESSYREQFEEIFYSALGRARALMSQTPNIISEVKLSPLQVPNFTGNIEHWLHFRDTFKSLVDSNQGLSDLQKFHYLLSSLKGEALHLVSSLEVTASNYKVAWEVLSGRYHNKRIITDRHIHSLFNLQGVKENHTSLRRLVDDTQLHLRALEGIGLPTVHWDLLMIHLVTSKLDPATRACWEAFRIAGELPTYEELMTCLTERARVLETASFTRQGQRVKVSLHAGTSQHQDQGCPLCSQGHKVYACEQFKTQPLEHKWQTAKKHKLCFNCLNPNHATMNCSTKATCRICGKKHNTLLHKPNQGSASAPVVASHSSLGGSEVLLSTVAIGIVHQGVVHKVRALLDCGSQSNFITKALCQRLRLPQHNAGIPVSGIQQQITTIKNGTDVQIASFHTSFRKGVPCLVLPDITHCLPQRTTRREIYKIPAGLKLADPEFNVSAPVEMLLGAEIFWEVLQPDRVQLGNDQPILQQTKLGWIVAGQAPKNNDHSESATSSHCYVSLNKIHQCIEKFWRIEDLTTAPIQSKIDILCEEHFSATYRRDPEGRFQVKLPFRGSPPDLGESQGAALKRLDAMERRFKKQPSLKEEYSKFMEEYAKLGHMTPCDPPSKEISYYLPHHAVFKAGKIRVVFDGSSKASNGLSLNKVLMTGPVIQNDLLTLLLKFRSHAYVMTADIEKMYRQIYVHPDDRDYQRIIWRSAEDQPIQHFQLNTVTYGLSPSSFLATRCLKQLAEDFRDKFPLASNIIESNFYMDDLLTGDESEEKCKEIKCEVTSILKTAGFNLVKWKSNLPTLTDDHDVQDKKPLLMEEIHESKILGLYWDNHKDRLTYKNETNDSESVDTKRSILSDISRTFDPLGLLGPIIIRSKLIMQDLWRSQVAWDEPLNIEIRNRWLHYKEDLLHIDKLHVSRSIKPAISTDCQLLGFCDASEKAYGGAVYLRTKDFSGNYHSHLVCAKSRVAPLKQLSLPRLELCGAVLLTKLLNKVKESLHISSMETILWTDSTIVLHWLSGEPQRWNTFVANRVSEIQMEQQNSTWRHIASQDNPADIISRGTTAEQLKTSSLWWYGPSWLRQEESFWPTSSYMLPTQIPESRALIVLTSFKTAPWDIFNRYSSYSRLLRVTAYMRRFVHNAKGNEPILNGPLSVDELTKAHNILIRNAQQEAFHEDIQALKNHQFVSSKSNVRSLNPFIRDGILYVGGRLSESDLPTTQKNPILLPAHHKMTELIVKHHHYSNLHLGVQSLLANIRLNYWPILGKNLVKKVFRKCILCFRYQGKHTYNQIMADLPRHRVTPFRPFSICGTDFMGPIQLKSGLSKNAKSVKAYVCLFICFATKAIHLELVLALSTESFLNALKRFISRRGKPQKIYSDNATNFVGAAKEIKAIYSFLQSSHTEIYNGLAKESIEWTFLPPRTPHFGGLWESNIKLVKIHLKKVLQSRLLGYEGMHTVLIQIEACVNSRPITPLSSDPNDLNPLTPAHFLIGESLLSLPERSVLELPVDRLNHYQKLLEMNQSFWVRWHKEYLNELQRRSKWHKGAERQLQLGDLVLIKEDNLPPMVWKMARVIETHPGPDGITRVVSLRTTQGVVKRGITKLCLLPMEEPVITDEPAPEQASTS